MREGEIWVNRKERPPEERNYQEIKKVLRVIDQKTLEGLAEDPRTGKPYPIVFDVVNEKDAQSSKKTDGKCPNVTFAESLGHAKPPTEKGSYIAAHNQGINTTPAVRTP